MGDLVQLQGSTSLYYARLAHRGVSRGEEDGEGGGQVNVLVSEGDKDTPTCTSHLPVQDGVEDGVVTLHVLQDKGRHEH